MLHKGVVTIGGQLFKQCDLGVIGTFVQATDARVKVFMPCSRIFSEPCLAKGLILHGGDPAMIAVCGIVACVDIEISTYHANGLSVEAAMEWPNGRLAWTIQIVGRVNGKI